MKTNHDTIYYKELNTFARKYLVTNPPKPLSSRDIFKFDNEYSRVLSEICELLLYHKKIAIYVYGENIPLVMLLNLFGTKGVEALLEQEAIEFVFSEPEVMYLVDNISGVMPLANSAPSSPAHSDQEKSIELGFAWKRDSLNRRIQRGILKKVAKAYRIPNTIHGADAINVCYESYKKNELLMYGLPYTKKLEELDIKERGKLCSIANTCNELAILSEFNYDAHNLNSLHEIYNKYTLKNLHRAKAIEASTDRIFELESLPDIRQLIHKNILTPQDIISIRESRDFIKFNKWLTETVDTADFVNITKEYLSAIQNTKGIFDSNIGKGIRNASLYVASAIIGGKLGGVEGTISGIGVGTILAKASEIGISLLDMYVLDNITKGWNPKFYFDNVIEPKIEESL